MEEEKREEINETGSIELTHNNRKHNIQLLTERLRGMRRCPATQKRRNTNICCQNLLKWRIMKKSKDSSFY